MTVPAQKLPSGLAWNSTCWFTYPIRSVEFAILGWYGISVGFGHVAGDTDFSVMLPPLLRLLLFFAEKVERHC